MRNTTFNWASIATLAYLSVHYASAAEPAQIPLSSRVAEPPIPNVALTIDDSGSMLADFMPEGSFDVNGKPVVLSRTNYNEWVGGFPADWRKLCRDGRKNCVPGDWPNGTFLTGVATAVKPAENVYQMHYRSPETNAIFYNPDLRYFPWYKPDGSRFPNADPKAAPYDPMVTNGTFNLSINYTGNAAILTNWFVRADSANRSTRDFYPGLVYRLAPGADPGSMGNFTAYDVNDKNGKHAADTKHPNRTDCAGTKCTQEEELQNFANWFTYYRMRETLTKAAVSDSFTSFKDKLRVSWGRINYDGAARIDGSTNSYSVIESESSGGPLRLLDASRLARVLGGVQKYASWGSTPLRTAMNSVGAYFDRSADPTGSPWLTDPSPNSSNKEKLTCRRSVSLVMTDGYYNDDTFNAVANVDGVQGPNHDGDKNPNGYSPTRYEPIKPYIDNYAKTLADVAMKYFVSDLDTNIENKVPPLTGDIAFWQHLTQFTVGLGVRGTLDSSTPAAKTATLKALSDPNGPLQWPDPAAGNPQKIDDMWHAAVNTGGDFYSVRNVTELTAALKDAFGRSAGNEAKEAGIATSSGSISEGNVKYSPKYKAVSWWGDLEAWPLGKDGVEGDTVIWRASEKLPKHDQRNLFTWLGSAPGEFKWDALDATTQGLVGTKGLADYVRGDDTDTGFSGTYRARDNKYLGDFVNSPPVLVKGNLDLGYSVFDSTYASFVAAKKARKDGLVFAGANDGMLHAFSASTGTEAYGYLPREGLARLNLMAARTYGTPANYHRFYVDGPLNETDAFIKPRGSSTAQWTNMVIGSMGAGGKAFFAINLPTDFGDTADAKDMTSNQLQWEISGEKDADVGYMFADFAVGKLKDGGWRAFVGNGVYSTSGNAVLLVVNMETGAIEHRLTVGEAGGNGLMGVSLIKDEISQEVVGAYAGDIKGSMWRFDFKGNDDIQVGFSGKPLFRSTDGSGAAQPITIAPSMVLHPQSGRVVLFGTGRLIDDADSGSTAQQTFYGVWDPVKVGDSSASAISPFEAISLDRSALQQQVASTQLVDGKYYEVTTTPVKWETQLGWYMDLPFERQRVLYPSFILSDKYVLFNTSVPAAAAVVCSTNTGVGYNYLLVAADGTVPTTPTFDTNGDGVIDERDDIVGGFETGNDGRDALLEGDGKNECVNGFKTYQDCSNGKACVPIQIPCEKEASEPQDRIWKLILNPPKPD